MKHILLYILLLCGSFSAFAQDQPPEDNAKKEQKIRALYVAYITQELKLNEAEAQKFWPLHAQFDAELKGVNLDMPELERQQSILNIKKKYEDKFTKVLGPNRTNDFYRKDGEFRKKLIEQLRKMRQQNNMNQRPGKKRNF
jgi:Skp family chaperone for outer membrane proteins